MAQQTRKWNPGDAANAFVRVILSDAGTMLGGMKDDEWEKTLAWFAGRCAYTDETLVDGHVDRDHAIPMNRTHCWTDPLCTRAGPTGGSGHGE